MAWNDRDYGGSQRYDARNHPNPILRILFGSVPMGTYFNTRVRIHATLILFIVFQLLSAGRNGITVKDAFISAAIYFFSILLHEFGHIFGSRIMGGRGEEILMWPLGGLAMVAPPHRPWPSFVSTVCGPLVNVLLCLLSGVGIFLLSHFKFFPPLDPRLAFDLAPLYKNYGEFIVFIHRDSPVSYYLFWIFLANWALLIFNVCLVMYPFDGGRMVQEAIWAIKDYRTSMLIASAVGMFGAVLLAMLAVALMASGSSGFMLLMIAIFGFMTCYQARMEAQAGYYDQPDEPAWASSLRNDPPKHRKVKKGWFNSAKKRAEREAAERAKIDAILAKVHDKGLHSLTWGEKRALKRATERQRQRDLAEKL